MQYCNTAVHVYGTRVYSSMAFCNSCPGPRLWLLEYTVYHGVLHVNEHACTRVPVPGTGIPGIVACNCNMAIFIYLFIL